jgi:hypothetical protein|nr:MAG TPA: replicative DNA helicase [Caudoviricetes sp.]
MGKKGGSSYHERPLSEEEKQLLRQQQIYLASIQPSIDKLVSRGTQLLDNVVNPDWQSIYDRTVNDLDGIRKEQSELATGKLPQAYADAKTDYFNRIYENTMGQQLSAMAKKGIVDSSRFNTATNDMQKNMAAQMSKDYTDDIKTQSGLLDQKYQFAQNPMELAHKANKYSFGNPEQYLQLAQGQNRSNTEALQSTGQLNNGRGYVTQKGSGFFGGLMSGIGSYLACFPEDVTIETDYGYIPINEVQVDDIVVSKDGIEKVLEVVNCGEHETMVVMTDNHQVETTHTQTVWTREGLKAIDELDVGMEILTDSGFEHITGFTGGRIVPVYELVCTGSNLFYANGIVVEGFNEEDLNAGYSL